MRAAGPGRTRSNLVLKIGRGARMGSTPAFQRRSSASMRSTTIAPGTSAARTVAVRSRAWSARSVSGLVAEAVNPVERADHVGRGAAAGDQDQLADRRAIVEAGSQKRSQPPGSSGQSNRLPPTLMTVSRESRHVGLASSTRPVRASRATSPSGCETLRGQSRREQKHSRPTRRRGPRLLSS